MMKRFWGAAMLSLVSVAGIAQSDGWGQSGNRGLSQETAVDGNLWTDHISYSGCTMATSVDGLPVAGNSLGLFYYDEADGGYLGKLTKVNMLSGVGISAIASQGKYLYVGYSDGNIDVVNIGAGAVTNIPELKSSSHFVNKSINDFFPSGNRMYCAFDGGVLEVDVNKREIKSTWRIVSDASGVVVNSVCACNGRIYAATAAGVYSADLSSFLLEDYNQWSLVDSATAGVCDLAVVGGKVIAAVGDKNGGSATLMSLSASATTFATLSNFRGLTALADTLVAFGTNYVKRYDAELRLFSETGAVSSTDGKALVNTPAYRGCAMLGGGRVALADYNVGMLLSDMKGVGTAHIPHGPSGNLYTDLLCVGSDFYCTSQSRNSDYNNLYQPAIIRVLRDGKWTESRSANNSQGRDAVFLVSDPNAPDSIYVSTWGTGIYKISDGALGYHFTAANSALTDLFGGSLYTRTDAIAYDSDHNLYVNNLGFGIKIKTPSGEWHTLSYGAPLKNSHSALGLMVTSNNNIWYWRSIMGDLPSYMIMNTNGTLDDDTDDLFLSPASETSDSRFAGTISLTDEGSGDLLSTYITAAVEDRSGDIWVGTPRGLLVCRDDAQAFVNNAVTFNRVRVPRNDGSDLADYLLDGTDITCISVDGANRKWIGTSNDGAYLVSAEGYATIYHFTAENSPLLSNSIVDIAIDKVKGTIYFATPNGLVSFACDASEPATKLDDITIYPNPIRVSQGQDYITMSGFETDSWVFVTDVAGKLVYRTRSLGGMARWNLNRLGGGKVSSGVYIVWASGADGVNRSVGKFAVLK